ncbi:hypothetical protein GOBAR_AA08589 [Gossypium barbadense]|uniref:Jacalin-type lectin domain-containing protein n=1 Tax=Gossypium barbadense TaxID=3634 RepID=A0A2P5Y8Y6_GOSBA|nr:hypothetical protein GOBAR_AA08589 [Gossypium barbadense]
MDLVLEEENDPIAALEGKKGQRAVEGGNDVGGPFDLTASSGGLKCGFENGIEIGAIGTKGGLSLEWKENSLVMLKSFSSFHIDVEVNDNECGEGWRLTGFYGNSDSRSKNAF